MFLKFLIFFSLISISISLKAQNLIFKGIVYNKVTNEPIEEVNVIYNHKINQTNTVGYFDIKVKKGKALVIFNHIAYHQQIDTIDINASIQKNIYLIPKETALNQITINSKQDNVIKTYLDNYQLLSKKDIEKRTGFLGNHDLLQTIKTLPGFNNSGDGNSGLYVRGGSSGQNLILFNNSTIYNPSHLLGFFSVFNTSFIKEAKVYKSGIPSEYSGRISSVIDIISEDEVVDSLSGSASLSFLSADFNLNVPLTQKWSVNAAARKTFMNYSIWPIINRINEKSSSINNLAYDFYDLNFSSALILSLKNKFFLTGYLGGDLFGFGLDRFNITNNINWKNNAASLNWRNLISKNAILNTAISYTGYAFDFKLSQENTIAKIKSSIIDYQINSILKLYLNHHTLKIGINYIDHTFKPNTPDIKTGNVTLDFGVENVYYANESSIYVSDDIEINKNLSVYLGTRLTYYAYQNKARETKEKLPQNLFFEPSFNFKYKLNKNAALKFSFSKNIQTVHLIPVTASNFPTDFWMPSTKELLPEKGIQFSLGFLKNWDRGFEAYVDVYYKKMSNVIEFNGGINNFLNNLKIEENISTGNGYAYGSEFFIKKNQGELQGSISYTISKNGRTFSSINKGLEFPFKYDRTHDININSYYIFNKRWNASALFTFATGNTYTAPISRYFISDNVINEYGKYNASRMPAYHRLDVALTYTLKSRQTFKSELSLSIYNLYNRENPIYDYFQYNGDLSTAVSIQRKSISLMPILPALNYKITFK